MKSLLLSLGILWLKTLRIHWINPHKLPQQGVLVLWHEHLPACIRVFSHLGISVLISKSADGAWAAEACRRFGYKVFRGSSSLGGQAGMKALARSLAEGTGLAGMALDGPKGPRRSIQPGSIWLSQTRGIPIIPVFIRTNTAFKLSTWDQSLVPMPFSKIQVYLGDAFYPKNTAEIDQAMQAIEHPFFAQDIYIATPHPT